MCSVKKGVLENFAKFTEKNLCWSAWRPATLLKRDSDTSVFLWILRNFPEHLFWKTSANGCFWKGTWYLLYINDSGNTIFFISRVFTYKDSDCGNLSYLSDVSVTDFRTVQKTSSLIGSPDHLTSFYIMKIFVFTQSVITVWLNIDH